jgi:glutamate racemase
MRATDCGKSVGLHDGGGALHPARMARPDQPLLILDSGVGGLSVLKEVHALLPQAPLVYVADNEGFPYGQKDPKVLTDLVTRLMGRLAERYDPALIVIACNTASTIVLDPVRAALDLPIVGIVPAIKPAAERSKTRAIGVLGTASTIVQPYVDNLARDFASDCLVLRYGTHDLVELAEAKLRGEPTALPDYARVLDGLLGQPGGERIDTIALACTHFPLVEEELAAAAPRPLSFVNGAQGIARRVQWLMRDHFWPDSPGEGLAVYTADFPTLDAYRAGFASFGLPRLETF